jgi:hypothetical protein
MSDKCLQGTHRKPDEDLARRRHSCYQERSVGKGCDAIIKITQSFYTLFGARRVSRLRAKAAGALEKAPQACASGASIHLPSSGRQR